MVKNGEYFYGECGPPNENFTAFSVTPIDF